MKHVAQPKKAKPLDRKTEYPARPNRALLYTAIASTGIAVILMSGEGKAHLKNLANSILSSTFPEEPGNKHKHGCHLLSEHTAIELHQRLSHVEDADLDLLQLWLESAHLRESYPNHQNHLSASNNTLCEH